LNQLVTLNPGLLSDLLRDKVSILHKNLSGESFVKLFILMQTQCTSLKKEFHHFVRLDNRHSLAKIRSTHDYYSGMPKQLPRWGNQSKMGWVYHDEGKARSLYAYFRDSDERDTAG
jgi:hypothetical protein